jgi:hypothetical protein
MDKRSHDELAECHCCYMIATSKDSRRFVKTSIRNSKNRVTRARDCSAGLERGSNVAVAAAGQAAQTRVLRPSSRNLFSGISSLYIDRFIGAGVLTVGVSRQKLYLDRAGKCLVAF